MTLIRKGTLAGIPIHYDRFEKDGSDYGTMGKPIRPYFDKLFYQQCSTAIASIQETLAPVRGNITCIVSAGVGRKGPTFSYHQENRAFDLDGLFFDDGSCWIANSFEREPIISLAIESLLRIQFGTVLNYPYDKAHEDHIHFDNGRKPTFRRDARTISLFIENIQKYIFGTDIGMTGVWSSRTEAAIDSMRIEFGLGSMENSVHWEEFCKSVAIEATKKMSLPFQMP